MSFVADLAQQTLRLAVERLEQSVEQARDVRQRRGQPMPLELQLKFSVLIQQLKECALQ